MVLISVKVLLAPGFVVLASLAGRRFGVRVGGMLGGLPVVAGPILLAYALAHGQTFAAKAATGTLLGLISLMAFVIVYARLASRLRWWLTLLVGWAAFFTVTLIFSGFTVSAGVALGATGVVLLAAPALLPRTLASSSPDEGRPEPAWDLPLRACAALALVLTLTASASWLGPQLSGLLAPFPVIASVLSSFTHAQRGSEEVLRLLRGLLLGYAAYGLFCFTLAVGLRPLGTAAGFLVATVVSLLCQASVLWRQRSHILLLARTPSAS